MGYKRNFMGIVYTIYNIYNKMMKYFKEKLNVITIFLICIGSPFISLFFDELYNKIYASGITFFTLIYLYVVFKLKTADELDNKCNSVGILIFLLWCICLAMWANVTKYIVG